MITTGYFISDYCYIEVSISRERLFSMSLADSWRTVQGYRPLEPYPRFLVQYPIHLDIHSVSQDIPAPLLLLRKLSRIGYRKSGMPVLSRILALQ